MKRGLSGSGLRLFAAVELPPELADRLAAVTGQLEAAVPPRAVRWVRPQGIHLTLQFYGQARPAAVAGLLAALQQAAAAFEPITLEVGGLGAFPGAERPRVIWVGVSGEVERLGRLQQAVQAACAPLGFAPEARPFSPHLTLGRVGDRLSPPELRQLAQVIREARVGPLGQFTAGHLSLMRSDLRPDGAVYTRLGESPLLGGQRGDDSERH